MAHHIFRPLAVGAALVSLSCLTGCEEKVDTSARYVYKTRSVMDYLEAHPAYSEYVKLLKMVPISPVSESTVGQLLSARGHYTVFAPTNEAIEAFLREQAAEGLCAEPSWDTFRSEEKLDSVRRVVVMNSVIDGGDNDEDVFTIAAFPQTNRAEFPLQNLNDKRLSVRYINNEPDSVFVNIDCPVSVTERDIPALNGVIHQVGKVIAPKNVTARSYIQEALERGAGDYLVLFRAIRACGLLDTLGAVRDEVYERLYITGKIKDRPGRGDGGDGTGINWEASHAPAHRLYGFTLFAEPDDYWRSQGLDPLDPDLLAKLTRWVEDNRQCSDEDRFTTDEDYASPGNLLYQWTTYHLLPERLTPDRLVYHRNEFGYDVVGSPSRYTIPVYEVYATMGKRRLLKLYESKQSEGVYVNRFANLDNGRRGTGEETSCDPDKVGARVGSDSPMAVVNDIVNCCIYPVDAPVAYTDAVRDNLHKQRLRFDVMSLFPEAMNNDIRVRHSTAERYQQVYIPNTVNEYDYFRDMRMGKDGWCVYWNWWNYGWLNLNVDEVKFLGRHEVTLTLPPVPRRGTYEFRYKVLGHPARGIEQLYFGDNRDNPPVAGIPVNLAMPLNNPLSQAGWEPDTDDDDYNAEVDKRMRNNGFMKDGQGFGRARNDCGRSTPDNFRRIVWRGTMDPDKTYYFKFKGVLDDKKEGFLDYLELCPKEVYDSPEHPEDIW